MLIAFLFSSLVLWVTSHLLESHAYLSLSYLWKCRLGLSEKEKERPLTTSQRLREIERRREMNLGYRLTPGIYPSDASLSLLTAIFSLPILCPWIRLLSLSLPSPSV